MLSERFRTFVFDEDILDLRELELMGTSGYREYIEDYIFRFDHHDDLAAVQGGYFIAATPEQMEILIEVLEDMKARMIEARS